MAGNTFTLLNNARAPFPNGDLPDNETGQIAQFVVNAGKVKDNTYDPTHPGLSKLRRGNDRIERLPGTPGGPAISAKNNVTRFRQLTLNENQGPGGPLEVLVNNSKWTGLRPDDITHNADASPVLISSNSGNDATNWLTELPQNSTTEIWEIINLTGDAHPIHIHEFQFQLINRQNFNPTLRERLRRRFPGGSYIPAYGPPKAYNIDQTPGNPIPTIGGNPDVTPFLSEAATPPLPQEQGWKDTFIMYPGQVTRIAVRWTPQNIKVKKETPGVNMFVGFDPTKIGNPTNGIVNANGDGGAGYVWHCHIIDHEDNEMMRPYFPVTNANNEYHP